MSKIRRILPEREALFTIGVFGVTQMLADFFADIGYDTVSAICRLIG